jgi:4-deoxy-L-threo-5-hexosulose-uronate ketol-isomerase
MTTHISERFAVHIDDYASYTTETLRKHFHVPSIFKEDSIQLTYTHYDRVIVGGAYPKTKTLKLEAVDQLKSEHFLNRRELGAINIGGVGFVVVDGERFNINNKEAIYIGATTQSVEFGSTDPNQPAKFYINSAPAHRAFPTKKVGKEDANVLNLGSSETSNQRSIYQLLIKGVVDTCQLQMGMTELKPGSVWNTMPAHTHSRRMEAYFYFDLPADQAVCHFMGPAHQTRHIWVNNEQAVVSPPWSMHSGCGTSHYSFIWGMAGENLDYMDMDHHKPSELK